MDGYSSGLKSNYSGTGSQYVTGNPQGTGSIARGGTPSYADLSRLQEGDSFSGKVISVNGEDVQIELENGQYVAAKLERDVQLALGQILGFEVKSNKDNKVLIKPVNGYNQLIRVGEAALKAANLALSDKNLQLVSRLIENGLPIDKNTLMAVNRLLLQHPDTDVSTILKMTKLQLPVTEESIEQFNNYRNFEHQLISGMEEAADEIFDLYSHALGKAAGVNPHQTSSPNSAININNSLNDAASGNHGLQTPLTDAANRYMEQIVLELGNTDSEVQPQNIINANETNPVNVSSNSAPAGSIINQKLNNGANPSDNLFLSLEKMANSDSTGNPHNIKNSGNINNAENLINTKNSGNVDNINNEGSTNNNINITNSGRGMADRIIALMGEPEADLNVFKSFMEESTLWKQLPEQEKARIFGSEVFKGLVKKALTKQWTLEPQDLLKDGKVQELYQKITKQSAKLSQLMDSLASQSGSGESGHTGAMTNIRNNMEFMNQMNQVYTYVQLPLRMSQGKAHGDLYVYTNKNKLSRGDGLLTAFLHLDMENIGNLDINVSLQTNNNLVTIRFDVEEDAFELLQKNLSHLEKRLSQKGYTCKNSVHLQQDVKHPKSIIQRIEEQVSGRAEPISYQSFDTRA